ncbi:prolyl oligopeptidase family serine peptidase [Sphingobacterium hotanense]|uniref:Prolyl oligopeptidase family serine peptidase n=2 Tax=Sphingobacterium TaxID=28453 RepID=A0ABT7NI01_9SPHI|nr:prolyl oligopeptidase family serine peptidase [Sphingobacterium hotanense]MDM1046812.1 prolyl oligopeptidase family serine peptidase [Sphingobacterium hotanense]
MKKSFPYYCICTLLFIGMLHPLLAQKKMDKKAVWAEISPYFQAPAAFENQYGDYTSVLIDEGGNEIQSKSAWLKQREKIKAKWMDQMGQWPSFLEDQKLQFLDTTVREGYTEYVVAFDWLPNRETQGYLLVPHTKGKKAAVLTVFYEPETAIGRGKAERDFALQLCKQGFVTLSIGTTETTNNKTYSLYYPSIDNAQIQPLSALAYAAANAWYVLANYKEVDSNRIGIMGHSYGGKWAMFGSCLFDKFACAVWSDPGIVFDETKGSGVNYWEPWYLGYYPPPWQNAWRQTGMIDGAKGLYPKLMISKQDLHELHALMAPRPFLVSGGSSDPIERWIPLNHTIKLNKLLGYENRVAMTNRPEHSPNAESNRQANLFFEYFLK